MNIRKCSAVLLGSFLLLFVLVACGSFGPPKSCGEGIGGSADEALFSQYFSSMDLVREATGETPQETGDNGVIFSREDGLAIAVDAKKAVEIRACAQERTGGGGIPMDKTFPVNSGNGSLPLGEFKSGSYVIRMIVDGKLVRNLTFEIK